MIIELQGVTMSQTGGFLKGNSRRTFPTLSISIFNRHDSVRKIALIHVKIQTIHGYQFHKGDVICLALGVSQMISKHEAASLGSMRMKINEH